MVVVRASTVLIDTRMEMMGNGIDFESWVDESVVEERMGVVLAEQREEREFSEEPQQHCHEFDSSSFGSQEDGDEPSQ